MTEPRAFSEREMLETASRAVGRVCRDDVRGITMLSIDDIVAMAGTLLAMGLVPTVPGKAPPEILVSTTAKEPENGQ
ncbi:hypothetical protein [Tabrizicola flagellatus]|uniref:hypothetical protein n=1 Tax=Tabrizicola flagellatus TaxID=2593021 RepID=UPI0011F3880F|nr:hypothetical protein [Tabrizicola flagellatus]